MSHGGMGEAGGRATLFWGSREGGGKCFLVEAASRECFKQEGDLATQRWREGICDGWAKPERKEGRAGVPRTPQHGAVLCGWSVGLGRGTQRWILGRPIGARLWSVLTIRTMRPRSVAIQVFDERVTWLSGPRCLRGSAPRGGPRLAETGRGRQCHGEVGRKVSWVSVSRTIEIHSSQICLLIVGPPSASTHKARAMVGPWDGFSGQPLLPHTAKRSRE